MRDIRKVKTSEEKKLVCIRYKLMYIEISNIDHW